MYPVTCTATVCRLALAALMLTLAACASGPPEPHTTPARADRSSIAPEFGNKAADFALQQVGQPYRFGGAGPGGFDCSGLVQYSYLRAGKALPRTTSQLWAYTESVQRTALAPGDLLFFAIAGKVQHVGLYVGDGRFVHAPSTGGRVTIASLDSDFYRRAFQRAGRPR